MTGYKTNVLSASTLTGDKVTNAEGEDLGKVEDIMINLDSGEVAYVVLSFGGILGLGDKLHAIPWDALRVDTVNKQVVLNVHKAKLETAPGFDKDHWPDMADPAFHAQIGSHYGVSRSMM